MSNTVSWVLQLKVKDGEYDTAKALMDEMSAATQADEPGALVYEWFVSPGAVYNLPNPYPSSTHQRISW